MALPIRCAHLHVPVWGLLPGTDVNSGEAHGGWLCADMCVIPVPALSPAGVGAPLALPFCVRARGICLGKEAAAAWLWAGIKGTARTASPTQANSASLGSPAAQLDGHWKEGPPPTSELSGCCSSKEHAAARSPAPEWDAVE